MAVKSIGKPREADLRVGELVEFLLQAIGFRFGAGDHRADPWQHQELVLRPPRIDDTRFDVAIELLSRAFLYVRREHCFGVARRERLAGIGRTGLDQHRPTLRTPGQIERPGHFEVRTLVGDLLDAILIDEDTALAIIDDSIVAPTVPQRLHHSDEFLADVVALRVRQPAATAEIPAAGVAE